MLLRKKKMLAAIKEGDAKTFGIILARNPRLSKSVLTLSWFGQRGRPLHFVAAGGSWDANSVLASLPSGFQFLSGRDDADLAMCQALVKSGAIVHCIDDNGNTPLHYACGRGHRAMAEVLLENGAHINYSNPMKTPPLEFALHYGHDQVASMLIERGAHLNYYEPITPLLSACQRRCVLAFRAMVASEPDVAINQMDHPDSFGDVPLHWAARTGCREIVQILIDLGANVNARNANGGTPLKSAHYGKFSDVATLLESHGGQL
jgi:hypothetical protein